MEDYSTIESENFVPNAKATKIFLISVAFTIVAVIAFGYFLINSGKQSNSTNQISDVVTEVDGKQTIDIRAKGGFSPNFVVAKSDKPTTLRITTENTYDCTSALNIPKLNYTRLLPTSGTTEIEIPAQAKDSEIFGTCNLGLYHFNLRFV